MTKPFSGSFDECVVFELKFRRKNPSLAERLGLSPDKASAEAWVDEQNAIRCMSHGWTTFVVIAQSPPELLETAQKKSLYGRVAGIVGKGRSALNAYQAMFGTHGPVDRELANRRAAVCAACPKNDTKSGLVGYFVEAAASKIMGLLAALKDLNLQSDHYEKLGICTACDCPTKAKVWAPISVIKPHITPEVSTKLDKSCWISTESR